MRLFVGVWPDPDAQAALSTVVPNASVSALRWVAPWNWHVTLAFLGSLDEDTSQDIARALRSVGSETSPATAVLGPQTRILGRGVLCVPVDGLVELAAAVRTVTDPLVAPEHRESRFVGHLTLARAPRRGSVPRWVAGASVSAAWVVREIRLVSSMSGSTGSHYTAREVVALGG